MCRSRVHALVALLIILAASAACSSATSSADPPAPAAACAPSETRCAGLQIENCGASGWAPAVDCADGQICRAAACVDLTADEQQRVSALSALFTESRTKGAIAAPVDYAALETKSRLQLLTSDGSPTAYVQTMWDALMSLPQGHQGLGTGAQTSEASTAATMGIGFNDIVVEYEPAAIAARKDPMLERAIAELSK